MSQPGQESVGISPPPMRSVHWGRTIRASSSGCWPAPPDLQRDVAEYREVAALLGLGDSGTGPPADLRARVLATAKGPAAGITALPRRKRSPVAWAAMAGRDCCGDCARGGGSVVAG